MSRSTGVSWIYGLRAHLAGQLWLPASLWLMFAVLVYTQIGFNAKEIAVSFAVVVLPLLAGIMAGYALVDDPGLELQFSAPLSSARMLLGRVGGQVGVVALAALLFQAYCALIGLDLSAFGSPLVRQLFWLAPCLVMSALGACLTLCFTHPTPAALCVASLWLLQLFLRYWFIQNVPARYFFLFPGLFFPEHPQVGMILTSLFCLAAVLFLASWALLKRQERYL